ncbi:MAG: RNA 2',3'-cyclic phosphodiesterase [Caldilinea sp. CFX5]|nr:RNA 2',3'-cyclic phosphodiesterase [Caldilinea sp. CFX5]
MRTFIAISLPAAVQSAIQQRQQQLETVLTTARLNRTVRWTPPAAVHVTLRFLGETSEAQRRDLQARLTRVTAHQQPFPLTLGELGCFPNLRAPAIVWLGLWSADETLNQLQQQIELAAQAAGFSAEHKPFRPHLTIGRMGRQVAPSQVRAIGQLFSQSLATTAADPSARAETARITFVVDHIDHIQSQLQPAGSVYTPLHLFNFATL